MEGTPIQFYVAHDLKERLQCHAKREGVSMSRLIRDILAESMEHFEGCESGSPERDDTTCIAD